MEKTDALKALTDEGSSSAADSVYHIYHTGSKKNCFAIHTTSDSRTDLNITKPATSRATTQTSQPSINDKTLFQRRNTWSSIRAKTKRGKYLDKPESDPRAQTAPYFVHLPTVYGNDPPYTLRHGGTKTAPTACLFDCSAFWRKWTLQFGDILSQEGVIDGRGVVNDRFGTKKGEGGTFKGYATRAKRYRGESGKQWHILQKGQEKGPEKDTAKAKPDEVVDLSWAHPFSIRTREYHFVWRGFTFKWKGTKSVRRAENFFQHFMRYHHLKLVVVQPREDGKGYDEILLAQYTSVPASRKAGRLDVYEDALQDFLSCYAFQSKLEPLPTDDIEKQDLATTAELRQVDADVEQRLRDLIVASAICMLLSEYQKRQTIIQILLCAIDVAGN